jgi:hypothetical protein
MLVSVMKNAAKLDPKSLYLLVTRDLPFEGTELGGAVALAVCPSHFQSGSGAEHSNTKEILR